MVLPLEGIRVLEFSQAIMAPECGKLLGALGADVIKLEPLYGDFTRVSARGGDSTTFLACNLNKRSLAINLKDKRGLEITLTLAKDTDVIIHNFRPGAMQKLGLDYESISKINPKVIYYSLYMYGEKGPLSHRRGGDPWGQAFTGVVAAQGSPDGPPYLIGPAVLDYVGAAVAAFGVVSALFMREHTGVGQELVTNTIDAGLFMQGAEIATYLVDGILIKKAGRGARGMFPYGAYPAKDGDVVTIFGQNDHEWSIVCSILGIEYLLNNPRYDTQQKRVERKFELYPIMDEAFRQKTREEWQQAFREHDLRCDPCLDYAEFVSHPQFEANDMVVETEHPQHGKLRLPAIPIKFKGLPPLKPLRRPPLLGEHSEEILLELGYKKKQIAKLHEEGVVGIPSPDMYQPIVLEEERTWSLGKGYAQRQAKIRKHQKKQ